MTVLFDHRKRKMPLRTTLVNYSAPHWVRMRGVSFIEVMITVMVLSFALLGLAKLQMQLQVTEVESYQRTQALLLARDMANRISTNRLAATSYITTTALGVGMTCPTTSASSSLAEKDMAQWCNAIQGSSESFGGSNAGSVIGGRGCVERLGTTNQYMITIAWQGLTPLVAPPASVTCGETAYRTTTGGVCDTTELCRRTVTTVVRFESLN